MLRDCWHRQQIGQVFATFLLLTACGVAAADPGDWVRVGKAGDWKDTIAGTMFKGRLYSVEKGGHLYFTNVQNGEWKEIGKGDFDITRFLFAGTDGLFSIEKGGSLYSINAADGSWKPVGVAADWKGTIAVAVHSNTLYSVEKGGALYETDLNTGKWKQIGKADFAKTSRLFATVDTIYSIEKDGSLFAISPKDGSRSQLGAAGDWKGTEAGAVHRGKLYTVETSGVLYETVLKDGKWQNLGKPEFATTRYLFNGGEVMYSIEKDGSLYRVKLK
jgi:hypothetical protein